MPDAIRKPTLFPPGVLLALACVLSVLGAPASARGSETAPGVTAVKASPVRGSRRALLIAIQNQAPGMDVFFPPLLYTTRDAVQTYRVLKSSQFGRCKEVQVLADYRQLMALQEEEALLLKRNGLSAAEREDSSGVLQAIDDILQDPATPAETLDPRGGGPTAAQIREAVERFAEGLWEGDEAILFTSGHGFRARGPRGGILGIGDTVLVASDTWVTDQVAQEQYGNAVEVADILEKLELSDAKRIFYMQATCASLFKLKAVEEKEKTLAKKGQTGRSDDSDSSGSNVTLALAALEFANESRTRQVRGDLFTWIFRLAMTGRLEELGPDWKRVVVDVDRDGAVSVEEAFSIAYEGVQQVLARYGERQEPYLLRAGRGGSFIVSGTQNPNARQAVVYPTIRKDIDPGQSKGIQPTTSAPSSAGDAREEPPAWRALEMHLDGTPIRAPQGVPAGKHRFELVDTGGHIEDRVIFQVQPGDSIKPEDIFRARHWRVEAGVSIDQWLGPSAYPETDSRASARVWSGAGTRFGVIRRLRGRPDGAWNLEAGGRLDLVSSAPVESGATFTPNYRVGVGALARVRLRVGKSGRSEIGAGMQGTWSYQSLYAFRVSGADVGWGPDLSWRLRLSSRQTLGLTLTPTFFFADFDCNPDLHDANLSESDPANPALLEHRCATASPAAAAGEDGSDSPYVASPGLYLLTSFGLAWERRF